MYGEKARDGLLSYMWSGPEEAPQVSSRHARPTSVTSNDSCLFRHVRARSERESGESGGATAAGHRLGFGLRSPSGLTSLRSGGHGGC